MILEVYGLWSPDLDPPLEGEGLPDDRTKFRVFIQVSLVEQGQEDSEVFGFYVCSPSMLAQTEPGTIITHTLVLNLFCWDTIRARVTKLLMHARSAITWDEVIEKLSGCLFHTDV